VSSASGARYGRGSITYWSRDQRALITVNGRTHRNCRDTMSGEAFEASVSVNFDGSQYRGCGRALH